MDYYHIELTPDTKRLCTIVFPWEKYEYQKLSMGLCNSPDIFQERISFLIQGLEYVRTYIDNLLIITKSDYQDHLDKLETVLNKLSETGLKVNTNKSFFARSELEYLGFWLTRESIKPLSKKVETMLNIVTPITKKELRLFIGIINYYRDIWVQRSDILVPLTSIASKQSKWN